MRKTIFIFTLVIVIGVISNTSIAFQRSAGHGHGNQQMQVPLHRWWKLPIASEQLNITPEETKKLDVLYQKIKEQLIDSGALLQKNMLKLEMQFDSDPFDQNNCLKSFKDAQAARTKLAMDKFEFALKTRALLGKERFEELLNTFKQFRRHYSKKRMQKCQGKRLKTKNNTEPDSVD
ncbi:MAG: hypothetical protein KAR45_13470 [Desulfobacteraceae bacterium]|nr:hypothetical protein [Desulfobacteraceae bacterium]